MPAKRDPRTGRFISNSTNAFAADVTRRLVAELADVSSQGIREALNMWIKQHGPLKEEMKPRLRKVNYRAMQNGKQAMITRYRQMDRPYPRYREPGSGRYPGGRLLRALKAKGNYQSDEYRIRFLNIGNMNKAAPQWYRLSFGAGIDYIYPVEPMRNPFNNRKLPSSPSTDNFKPSRSFDLPDNADFGFYVTGKNRKGKPTGRFGEIHVGSKSKARKEELSIEAEGWVQEGVEVINKTWPTLLFTAMKDKMNAKDEKRIIKLKGKL